MKGGEYFKVIDLVDHYNTHQSSSYVYTDFMSFLNDHYLKKSHHEREHEDLPFKSQSIQSVVFACFLNTTFIPVLKEYIEFTSSVPSCFTEEFISIYNCSIWNPPQ
jgi:hypothetical protein